MNDQRLHPPGADCAGTSPDAAGAFSHDALADELESLRGKDTDTLGRWLFDNRDAVAIALRRLAVPYDHNRRLAARMGAEFVPTERAS